jgi:2-hydroxycyclohexanecarboxyl-CoA dehydrogenase
VSLSSVSGQRGGGVFGTSAYSAAKAGIMGLTKALARELSPRGIRVNCIAPSMIDTDIAGPLMTEERKVELAQGTLLGRLGTVQDVVDSILFLVSDESAYLTGVRWISMGGCTCTNTGLRAVVCPCDCPTTLVVAQKEA